MRIVAHIVSSNLVMKRLMQLERSRGTPLVRFALLMQRSETWALDDIHVDEEGRPIGVSDERGSAEDRIGSLMQLERLMNSDMFAACITKPENATADTGRNLVDVMAYIRTSRFLVCLHHISSLSVEFVNAWFELVDQLAMEGNVMAHVVRSRLIMLRRANMVHTIFSREAASQVMQTLQRMS